MPTFRAVMTLVGVVFVLRAGEARGQEETCQNGNPGLRDLLQGGERTWSELNRLLGISHPCEHGGEGCFVNDGPPLVSYWATSLLSPRLPPGLDATDAVGESCRYAPNLVRDSVPSTAWCEGVEGDGVGEILALLRQNEIYPGGHALPRNVRTSRESGQLTGLRIWGGYGRSAALFRANGRVHRLHLSAVHAELREARGQIPEYGQARYNLTVTDLGDVELRDVNGFQEVQARSVPLESLLFLAVEIRSVYPGTRYRDTCVSEAHFVTNAAAARR